MTFERIKNVIAEQVDIEVEKIEISSTFEEDLGIDSLDIFEIVMELEEEFELEIPTEDLENMKKVEDLVNYINTKLN